MVGFDFGAVHHPMVPTPHLASGASLSFHPVLISLSLCGEAWSLEGGAQGQEASSAISSDTLQGHLPPPSRDNDHHRMEAQCQGCRMLASLNLTTTP